MGTPLIIADAMPTSTLFMPVKKMICGMVMPTTPPISENHTTCLVTGVVQPRTKLTKTRSNPPKSEMEAEYKIGSIPPRITIFEMAGTLPRTAPSATTNKRALNV